MPEDREQQITTAILRRYVAEDFGQDTALLEAELAELIGAEDADAVLADLAEQANDLEPEDL